LALLTCHRGPCCNHEIVHYSWQHSIMQETQSEKAGSEFVTHTFLNSFYLLAHLMTH
jgi:hypothetical protein